MPTNRSLGALMDQLEVVEGEIAADVGFPVYCYRWRPNAIPDMPAIYNWLAPSPSERWSTAHMKDELNLLVNCAIRWADAATTLGQLEDLADATRHTLDLEFQKPQALGGVPEKADRLSMQSTVDSFGDVDVLVIQFPIRAVMKGLITE